MFQMSAIISILLERSSEGENLVGELLSWW